MCGGALSPRICTMTSPLRPTTATDTAVALALAEIGGGRGDGERRWRATDPCAPATAHRLVRRQARPSPTMPRPAMQTIVRHLRSSPDCRTLPIGEKPSDQTTVKSPALVAAAAGRRCCIIEANPGGNAMMRQALLIVGLLVAGETRHSAQQQKIGAPPEASNMRLAGWSDLQARSAYQPTDPSARATAGSPISAITAAPTTIPTPVNPHDRQGRAQRHVDRRRHRSRQSEISAPPAGRAGHLRGRRRADGAGVRRQRACRRAIAPPSTCCAPSAARRMRSGTSPIRPIRCWSRGWTA